MKSAKGNLLAISLVVLSMLGLAGCGGDSAAGPTATTRSLATATSAATSTPKGDAWQTFTSTEGRFSAAFPGEPTESNQIANSEIGELNNYFFKHANGSTQYVVSYVDYPADAISGSDPKLMVAEGFSKTFESSPDTNKVVSKSEITVDGHPGMEAEIEYTSGNYVWYKQLLVDNRMYQVLATALTSSKNDLDDEARKFHESFELLSQPTAIPANTKIPAPTEITISATPTEVKKIYEFLSTSDYESSFGGGDNVVGVIRYNGSQTIASPEIVVTLRDTAKTIVATEKAFTVPSIVRPGGLIPFKVSFFNQTQEWATYTTEIQANPIDSFSKGFYYDEFEFIESKIVAGGSSSTGPKIIGTVKNIGTKGASSVQIIGALFDAKDEVVDVSSGFSKISEVAPGDTSTFEIDFSNDEAAVRYELVVTSFSLR